MHIRKIRLLSAGALVLALPATSLLAQGTPGEIVQQINPEADRLAQDMKILAADPKNVPALISAGRGALAMGDPNGALSFFLRAQDVSPNNGQAKAGMASALVELERPGEALRLFDEATRHGVAEVEIAADRGLAYDLVGDQARAQRDYAMALARRPDDEVTRRYALSLGISNRRAEAMALLDPLLRKQDRAAWRSRAFILAMTGDEGGAAKIAEQTLPASMAQMLRPYFDKLEDLDGGERAFAVHYGHLGGDAARLARQSAPRPAGPVIAAATAPPPRPAAAAPTRMANADTSQPTRTEQRAAERTARQASRTAPAPAIAPGRVAAPTPSPAPARTATPAPTAVRSAAAPAASSTTPAPTPARNASPQTVAAQQPAAPAVASRPTPTPAPTATRIASAPTTVYGPPASAAKPTLRAAAPAASAPTPSPAPAPPATRSAAVPATPAARTDLLASIIAGIDIPQAELAARPAASLEDVARVQAEERRAARAARAREEAAAKKAAEAKAAADAAAAKKKADAEAAAKKKAAPERYWVQIATGANPAALARDFKKMVARAPVLKGQDAWTARFGGTRRMLVGPFGSEREAIAFMSKAKAAGVDGYNWTSPEGAEVEKLPPA
ncbi:SPOR domain-containing protein [Sphingomonas gilva]|uniref:SPOR domain-containing protein n=1 Tax=Sphingomonas gilva TaxID=2305907 RepID=A0A396RWG3_9SPHN|nr:SPOR domain-containing protein [Sphingomonas gilva]RHW18041.1 SPOR domain-containing protein [Sphingomonas gilva]